METQNTENRLGQRSAALDALRGVAILGMGWSGRVPWGTLPAWMYHAQSPPPKMAHDPTVYGITWVDLVFPFFLFALGAALPFSLGKRLESGESGTRLCLDLLKRGALLALFAMAAQHFRPDTLQPANSGGEWSIGVAMFFAMALAWGQFPACWPRWVTRVLALIGVAVCAAGAYALSFKGDPSTWSWGRSDIILLVLANVVVSGSAIWWATRNKLGWRVGVIVGLAVAFAARESVPAIAQVWGWAPVPSVFRLEFHKYLLIVLPGTIVGDWLRASRTEGSVAYTSVDRSVIALAGLGVCVASCVGLLARDLPTTAIACACFAGAGIIALDRQPDSVKKIGWFGVVCLLVGLVIEPLGGGIRKDPTTLSYFFVTSGLACWALLMFRSFESGSKNWNPAKSVLGGLALAGANPMIAYIAITNLVPGLMRVSGIHGWANEQPWSPWGFAGYGLAQTVAVGIVAALCTRQKIFMRT